jgi:AraC-like DNA-binding protein
MEEGFLEEHNIDTLAEEVGYNSRASLYTAFKQVMGTSLPDFRLEREV